MSLRLVLQRILFTILLPLSLTSAISLYLYPVLQGCAFPVPATNTANDSASQWVRNGVVNTLFQHAAAWSSSMPILPQFPPHNNSSEPAIFRLLVLADPQIEGDSSLPSPDDEFVPRLRRHWATLRSSSFNTQTLKDVAHTIAFEDFPSAFRAARKRLDLLGNDYYLAHIYRTLSWWSRPTHVTVLGDLIGSQWVNDEEFENRAWRYWNRVFRDGERVNDDITISHGEDENLETLQRYNSSWANRIINIAGNHDIGYAGDVSKRRLERFEQAFGRANWDIRFVHPPLEGGKQEEDSNTQTRPTLHIINLNDLTLDGPPFDQDIQSDSYAYINDILNHRSHPVEDQTSFTLLLTHVPLHKREGVCVDGPYFTFFDHDDGTNNNPASRFRKGGLREQNHLSEYVSTNAILEGIFGMSADSHSSPANGQGRRGLILTGHDHEGCDVIHFINRTDDSDALDAKHSESYHWDATRYHHHHYPPTPNPSIREVTMRSMMGQYDGNAALLSLWFDSDPAVNQWQYEIQMCPAGVQHIWWAVHGLAFACLIGLGIVTILRVLELAFWPSRGGGGKRNEARKS
ncbi:hypothetical protein UA08_08321 [Talaromyces atroroseus]|uniref:Calcineurin-like phosphoesterase domain-containing protein n=1 Tax=Talaromyces atroroseus TaxID=1441469 RepID=A0A225AHH3_TALAT|nr:hypothetical protein UA08_08321 [Talaromyces atroroseus]OKL56508.1 hypothetical protein UA08_08321 [Talaromyces atroroseus]